MRPDRRLLRRLSGPAERAWRPLLLLAGVVFAASGPVHATGRDDVAYHASLIGVALGAVAVPLGLLGLFGRTESVPARKVEAKK